MDARGYRAYQESIRGYQNYPHRPPLPPCPPPQPPCPGPPAGGVTGIASAILIGGIQACNKNVNPSLKSVQMVQMTNAGSGYTAAPTVTITSSSGTGATVGVVTIQASTNNSFSIEVTSNTKYELGMLYDGLVTINNVKNKR